MRLRALHFWVALALAGCVGTIGDGGDVGGGSSGAGGGSSSRAGGPSSPAPAFLSVPVMRLTTTQYNLTLKSLFAPIAIPDQTLPVEITVGGFRNNARAQAPSPDLIEQLATNAKAVASLVTADPTKITGSCADLEACGESFIDSFGKRAFRRPLTSDERTRLVAAFSSAKTTYDFPTALRMTIETILQAPQFLYLVEVGDLQQDGRYALRPYEVASRLSYFLWNTMPDDALFASADSAKIKDVSELEAQARRLMADPRAHDAVAAFHAEWLRMDKLASITKSTTAFPYWSDAQSPAALRDSETRYIDWVFWQGGTLGALLTDTHGFVNDQIAPMFGVPKSGTTSLTLTGLDPTQRSGILTQPALMAALAHQTDDSPVLRGVFVLNGILCAPPPPPPPGVNQAPPPQGATPKTTRDRFAETHEQGACAGCHHIIDGVGFGFEHYDATGAWRTTDSGYPVDATGWLVGTDVDGPFDGAVQLGQKLAKSTQVETCIARNWLRYALGLAPNEINDVMTTPVARAFADHGLDMRELLVSVVTSDAFRFRTRTP